MTDDLDTTQNILTRIKRSPGIPKCPRCGMFMQGFSECPWCGGTKKVVRVEKVNGKLWVGKERIR